MAPPSVRYTHTDDDVAIAWAERGNGPPLVVSTGPMIPLDLGWELGGVWERLSQSFRVIRFDPRGCGLSERDGVFSSFYDEAVDLVAVAGATGEPRVALLGYYIGTPTAVIAMLNEPDIWRCICQSRWAASRRPINSPRKEYSNLVDNTVENLLRLGWKYHEEYARRALLTIIAPSADEATLCSLSKTMHHYPSVNRLFGLIPEIRSLNLRQELRSIEIPTLISIPPEREGFDDGFGSHGCDWARLVPNARLVIGRDNTSLLITGTTAIDQLAEALVEFISTGQEPQTAGQATHTILFTDIEESTSLVDRLRDEEARAVTRDIEQITASAIRSHAVVQVKSMGDGVLAWFSAASAAADAAVEIQSQIAAQSPFGSTQVRIGISAGEPISELDDLYGATVNLAARVMSAARGERSWSPTLSEACCRGAHTRSRIGVSTSYEDSANRLFSIDWRQVAAESTSGRRDT